MPSVTSTTMASAIARGTWCARRSTAGCKWPASAAAASSQPITRADDAITPMAPSVRPSMTTARTIEIGVRRSTAVRGGAAIETYRTGVPDEERVIRADLDWRTVAWLLGAFVVLVAFTALVHAAGRPLTWIGVGTLLA